MLVVEAGAPPEAVSAVIAEHLAAGAPYVHLSEVPFLHTDPEAQADYIRRVSQGLGELSLSDGFPGSDVWRLDNRTSTGASRIPFHTDNPFYDRPEQLIGFWNVQSSPQGGENVLLPADAIWELAARSSQVEELVEKLASEPVPFNHDRRRAIGPILDEGAGTVRFDRRYVGNEYAPLADQFVSLLESDALRGDKVRMAPGDALIFNNREWLHAREPYAALGRLSFRTRIIDLAAGQS